MYTVNVTSKVPGKEALCEKICEKIAIAMAQVPLIGVTAAEVAPPEGEAPPPAKPPEDHGGQVRAAEEIFEVEAAAHAAVGSELTMTLSDLVTGTVQERYSYTRPLPPPA